MRNYKRGKDSRKNTYVRRVSDGVRGTARRVIVSLVGLELPVIAELNVNRSSPQLRRARRVVSHHRRCRTFVVHFQKSLKKKEKSQKTTLIFTSFHS